MRKHTTDQEVLQSAATAMKHSLKMQSSDTYDLDTHIRATQAAMNFCHEFATSTEAIVQPPATPPMEQPQPSNADFDAIDDVMSPIQPTWDRQLPPTAAVGNINTVTQANTTSPHPQQGTAVPTDESILEPQYEINIVTAGEIVQGGPRHRILWEESPELLQWWGELPENFVFQSAKYVPREILIQTGRSKKDVELGIIGSIQPPLRSSAEVQLANGSMVQLDLLTCVFKRLNADQPKIVTWQLTCPETWLLEDDKWPVIPRSNGYPAERKLEAGMYFPYTDVIMCNVRANDGHGCKRGMNLFLKLSAYSMMLFLEKVVLFLFGSFGQSCM